MMFDLAAEAVYSCGGWYSAATAPLGSSMTQKLPPSIGLGATSILPPLAAQNFRALRRIFNDNID
jgi:hypothetical protein